VHPYGQSADFDPILELCVRNDVTLIEDAAEAPGATHKGRSPGTFGAAGISFNGNKIITTSGGDTLVSPEASLMQHTPELATQVRDPAPHDRLSEKPAQSRVRRYAAKGRYPDVSRIRQIMDVPRNESARTGRKDCATRRFMHRVA
jgi:dTDP-4-amino-4,6-dideoxygalactose transaminase